jgi:hypothetical protein
VTSNPIVILVDVDNTLLDNDHIQADVKLATKVIQ